MLTDVWPILRLSLLVSGTAVLVASLIGVPLGVWLGRRRGRGQHAVWTAVYAGMALPPVVAGLVIYLLLSRSGPLGFLGWLYTPVAMVLAQVVLALPFVVGVTMTAVAAIPDELRFQLRALGATELQARRALLREARPGVVLAVAAAPARSLSEVGAVWMVGGNIEGHTRVLTTAIVLETGRGQFALALLLGAVLLALALLVDAVILRFRGPPLP